MNQLVYPKGARDTWFYRSHPEQLEIDWRNSFARCLYGVWIFGYGGPPRNLVTRAYDLHGGAGGAATIQGNFGHGSYSASGAPVPAPEVHGGAALWSAGNEGIDLSLASAFKVERDEPLTLVLFCTPNVLRSGASVTYSLFNTKIDSGSLATGFEWRLVWDGASQTRQQFGETANFGANNYFAVNGNSDVTNGPAVLGVSYTGSSAVAGVTLYHSGSQETTTTVRDTLTSSIIATTPFPTIGYKMVGGVPSGVFKGKLSMLYLWRGVALGMAGMDEMDTNPQQLFLVPSYRRWSIPAVTGTPIPIRRAGAYA